MLYDEYKAKMEKLKRIKDKIMKFKWPFIVLISSFLISFIIISTLMGKSSGIEISSNFTYGDSIELSCNPYMSNIIRYEYKKDNEEEWTNKKPYKVGNYEVRAISRGLFSERICAVSKFSIEKKDLVLTITDDNVVYGNYPNYLTNGLLDEDLLNGLSFSYDDISSSNTLVNFSLSGLRIINDKGEDVTDCYKIVNNSELGSEITFTPLELILSPDINDKVYDGLDLNYHNSYVILENEAGYNDLISIETKIYDELNQEIDNPIQAGKYKVVITKSLVNDKDNPNYRFTYLEKSFEIKKRDIVFNTLDYTKTYDGTYTSNTLIEVDSNYTLAKDDNYIASDFNQNYINAGSYNNNISIKIFNNDIDRTDSYNIIYKYGNYNILKKDLIISTSSSSKEYDGTILESKEYSYEGLIEKDSLNLIKSESILTYGTKDNVLEFIIKDNDMDVTNNYNIIYNYGTLKITKSKLKIKLSDVVVDYNSKNLKFEDLNVSYEIIEGSLYLDDTIDNISGEIENNNGISHAGIYNLKGIEAIFTSLSNKDSYDIEFIDAKLTVNKVNLTIQPQALTKTFDYGNNVNTMSDFIVKEGNLYNGNDLFILNVHYEFNNEVINPYNVGLYDIVIDNVSENLNKTSLDNLDDYIINFDKNSLTINKKDVDITISNQSSTYNGTILNVDLNKVEISDELLKNNIIINSCTDIELLNTNTYTLKITDFSVIEDNNIKKDNYNFNLLDFNYIIEKRKVELKVKELADIVYDAINHEIDSKAYDIISGSFVNDDMVNVVIKDVDNKDILNAGLYNLIIEDTDHSLDQNYIFEFANSTPFTIIPLEIDILPSDETYIFDGSFKYPNGEYSFSNNVLLNNDTIDIFTKLSPVGEISEAPYTSIDTKYSAYSAGDYIKSVNYIEFNSGNNISVKDNYKFNFLTSSFKVLKRDIVITANQVKQYYGSNIDISIELTSFLKDDIFTKGLVDVDIVDSYNVNEINNYFLNVGVYDINISNVSIKRNINNEYKNIDSNLDYNITYQTGNFIIEKRPVKIIPNTLLDESSIYYDKFNAISLTNKSYECVDTSEEFDSTLSTLLFNIPASFNMHIELDSNKVDEAKNANTYTMVIDSYIDDLSGVSNNFIFEFVNKDFTIQKRSVSVKYKNEEVIYDGSIKSPTLDYLTTYNSFFTDIDLSFKSDYKYQNVGDYEIEIVINNINDDLMSNYNIIYEKGIFSIKKRDILIKLINEEVIYDNSVHAYDTSYFDVYEVDGTIIHNSLIDSSSIILNVINLNSKEIKEAGTYNIQIKNVEISDNFNVLENTYLNIYEYKVLERNITIKAYPNNKVYDGTNFENNFRYVTILDEGNSCEYIDSTGYNDSIKNISYNYPLDFHVGIYKVSIKDVEKNKNYIITVDNSEVDYEINKRIIHIIPYTSYELVYSAYKQVLEDSWVYDPNYQDTNNYSLDRNEISVKVSEINDLDIINAGTYTLKLEAHQLYNNYIIYTSTSEIVVKRKDVEIKAMSKADELYDKQVHDSYDESSYQIICDGITYTNSFKDLSTTKVTVIYKDSNLNVVEPIDVGRYYIYINTFENNPNYNVTISNLNDVTFNITKRDITVSIGDYVCEYDGNEFIPNIYLNVTKDNGSSDILQSAMPEIIMIHKISYTDSLGNEVYSIIDVGTYYVKYIEVRCADNDGEKIVNDNYNISYEISTITIIKKKYNLYLSDLNLTYDGLEKNITYAGYVAKDLSGNIVNVNLDVYASIYKNNQKINPVIVGEYDLIFERLNYINMDESNYELEETFNAKVYINKLDLNVVFDKSNYTSVYGDTFDLSNHYTTSSNTNNTFILDLNFIYQKNDSIYYDTSLLDSSTYQIKYDSINSIYNDNIELVKEYVNIIFDNDIYLEIVKRNISVVTNCGYKTYDGINLDPNVDFILSYQNVIDRDLNSFKIVDCSINLDSNLIDLTKEDSLSHAGEYSINSLSLEYSVNRDVSFNDNYIIDFTNTGNIYVIYKRILDISISKAYDNLPIYDGSIHNLEFNFNYSNNLNGDLFEIDNKISARYAGIYEENRDVLLKSSTNNSHLSDYSFDEVILKAEVLAKDLVITTESNNLSYDGYTHNFLNYINTSLALNDYIQISSYKEFKNVCESIDNAIEFNIYNEYNILVNDSYNITYIYGKINIYPIDITIKSVGLDEVYVGHNSPYYSKGFIYNLNGDVVVNDNYCLLSYGDTNINIIKDNLIPYIDCGTYTESFTVKFMEDLNDISSNFNVNYVYDNQIIIRKRNISVSNNNYVGVYNGKSVDLSNLVKLDQEIEDYIVLSNYLLTNNGIIVDEMKYAGTYVSKVSEIKLYDDSSLNKDLTNNYNISYSDSIGTHTIMKYQIALISTSAFYVWDGVDRQLTKASFYEIALNKEFSPFEGEAIFNNFATLKAYKDSDKTIKWLNNLEPNKCNYDIRLNGLSLLDNYDVIENFGTLGYLTDLKLYYEYEVEYDGTNQTLSHINEGKGKVKYTDIEIPTSSFMADIIEVRQNDTKAQMINAGSYECVLDYNSVVLKNMVSNSLSYIYITYQELIEANYNIEFDISLTVKPREIIIQPDTYKVEYDGLVHQYDESISYTTITSNYKKFEGDNKVLVGDTLTFVSGISGSNIGYIYSPIISFKVLNSNGVDITYNYNLLNVTDTKYQTYKYCPKLYISLRTLNISCDNGEFKYDGTAHMLLNPVYDSTNLLTNHHIVYSSLTNPGYSNGFNIYDQDGKDVTNKYKFKYNMLHVKGLTISISTGSKSKVYDGTALTSNLYWLNDTFKNVKMDGLRDGDTLYVTCTGKRVEIGSSKNYFQVVVKDINGNDVTYLYDYITYREYGVLTVLEEVA